jgi:enamine deaminase RidA (YjgF/YER057c/UK114 family)
VGRRRISSGSPFEPRFGYSRAVVVGNRVFVSGTTAEMADGAAPPPDAYTQARRCFEIIFAALAEVGGRPDHIVRTRMYLTRERDFGDVLRAHGELFSEVRPAATAVVVRALIEPDRLVEIEADAVLPPGS